MQRSIKDMFAGCGKSGASSQSKIIISGAPLGESGDDLETTVAKKKEISKTAAELLEITPEQAKQALERCIQGIIPPVRGTPGYQPNAKGFPPAVRSKSGCLLVQKSPATVSQRRMGLLL